MPLLYSWPRADRRWPARFVGKRGAGRVSNSSLQPSSARPKEQQARLVQTLAQRLFKRLPDALSAQMSDRERSIIAQQALEFFTTRSEMVKVGVITHVIGGAPVTVIE